MRTFDWAELGIVVAAGAALYFATSGLEWTLSYGKTLCYAAALILGQGLVRDLSIILKRKINKEEKPAGAKLKCLCAESSLGLLVITLGSLILLAGIDDEVKFTQLSLTATVSGIMILGFLIKDYVVMIRKEEDHQNLIIW
jgi:hypothetical protein